MALPSAAQVDDQLLPVTIEAGKNSIETFLGKFARREKK